MLQEKYSFPTSFAQQRLWVLDQFESKSPVYNVPLALHLRGKLDHEAIRKTLQMIIDRHESLRTVFSLADDQPVQVIAASWTLSVPMLDLRSWPPAARMTEAQRVSSDEANRAFDLINGPLLRVMLIQLDDQEHLLLLTLHHIIFDMQSRDIFFKELSQIYTALVSGAEPRLEDLPIQYADFAHWQRQTLQGEQLEQHMVYWRRQLENIQHSLQLPLDHPRPPVQTFSGAQESITIPLSLVNPLQALGRQESTTLFMTLLAAFKVLLYRYTEQSDLTVGTPTASRLISETQLVIGFFTNMLVLRTSLSDDLSFRDVLRRVRATALAGYEHQEVPFERLVEELQLERHLNQSPLFQVSFSVQPEPSTHLNLPGITAKVQEVPNNTSKFDLTLSLFESADGVYGQFIYCTDLFDAATIRRMVANFLILLAGIAADPEQPVDTLPVLSAIERETLLTKWNATYAVYPQDACLHERFEAQVQRTPDALALIADTDQLRYAQLNARANQVAHLLRSLGIGPDQYVGIYMERTPELVIALLGVLKAGAAYLPLDPGYPQSRLQFMLDDGQAEVVLTQRALRGSLEWYRGHVIVLDAFDTGLHQQPTVNVASGVTPANLAYIIYTSGSTGRPKGVMIPHQAIVNHMEWMREALPLTADDRVLQKTPISFDASVWEFYAPLLIGAQLVLAQPGGHQDAAYLATAIQGHQITILQVVPTLLQLLIEEPDFAACRSLKRVYCGGEALPSELRARFQAVLPQSELYNLYGPTEATINATYSSFQRDDRVHTVPIGRPVANTQIYLLDRRLQPVPVGALGELYIGGAQLARGYRQLPAMTAEKFIPHSFSQQPGARLYRTGDLARYRSDGSIEYLGRTDNQVKLRGFRIDLGEIESTLTQHPALHNALVVMRADEQTGDMQPVKRLVAYIGANPASITPTLIELRSFLIQRLPEYMIPNTFVFLDALPLLPNGKVDRTCLPAPEQQRLDTVDSFVAPRTPIEHELAEIWAATLRVERVGVHDNFFVLGGNSLLATQVISRVRDRLQVRLLIRHLFEQPTVSGLASKIAQLLPTGQVATHTEASAQASSNDSLSSLLSKIENLSDEEVLAQIDQAEQHGAHDIRATGGTNE